MSTDKEISQSDCSDALVFLNTPINSTSEDIIGFSSHVNSLRNAIENGAQLIAVTSPFGAGKSSLAELLRSSIKDENVKLINISMWSHLCNQTQDSSTLNLHRSFLYQLVSKIDSKKGEYINRKLSPNYGILKLHTKSGLYSFLVLLAAILFFLGYILPELFKIGFPVFVGFGSPDMWNSFFVFLSIVCISIVIVCAEVVFSSKSSEGKRIIETNEIFELYQKFVCKELKVQNSLLRRVTYSLQKLLKLEWPFKKPIEKYIVVIEDLDRSDSTASVVTFLKELRKYYVQDLNELYCDKPNIVFIVNVKPESSLYEKASIHKKEEHESLYAKIFDYILNIQTVNIADYETILESILFSKKDKIQDLLSYSGNKLVMIPGMQWVIRGDNLGIRDIKDRLNKAFNLYNSLKYRFSGSDISFEKCAVVAYLTTKYEKSFIATKDGAFGKVVEANLQNKLTSALCKEYILSDDEEYIEDVISLVQAKHIDSNYRMYFYSYPKDSIVYTHDELVVQNALLYDEFSEDLFDKAYRVVETNPIIISSSLKRVESLKLPLPSTVFKTEPLFLEALKFFPEYVYSWVRSLDYSANGSEKTSQLLIHILMYDEQRAVYTPVHFHSLCTIWEEKFGEKHLLKFRKLLCNHFSQEILSYISLFKGVHSLISYDEMDKLCLEDAINLINLNKEAFNIDYVEYILNRFDKEPTNAQKNVNVKAFLIRASNIIEHSEISSAMIEYMKIVNTIVPEFEEIIIALLQDTDIETGQKQNLFSSYQDIINETADNGLSVSTLTNIHLLERHKGFSEAVANWLLKNNFIFDSIVVRLFNNKFVNFNDSVNITSIKENSAWLLSHMEVFDLIRFAIIKTRNASIIRKYGFLFAENCRLISTQEFDELEAINDVHLMLEVFPSKLVTEKEARLLAKFFSKKFRSNQLALKILLFVSEFKENVSAFCFNSLDFDNSIKYRSFSDGKKASIKSAFSSTLDLDSAEGKIAFMERTRFVDRDFELSISDDLKADEELQRAYVNALNKCDINSITQTSLGILYSFDNIYLLNDMITEKIFKDGKYAYHVASKTCYNKKFTMEVGNRFDLLWPTYIKILSSSAYQNTRLYMSKNMEFLNTVISKGAYEDFPEENRKLLCVAMQDEASLRDVVSYGTSFAQDYFSSIGGFKDEASAKAFIEIIEENDVLLRSDDIYEHTYEMLISGKLKAKYTRMRNRVANY